MTISADDFVRKITPWHAGRPKFVATVKASVDPIVAACNAAEAISSAFDIDTAIGAQLDVDGEWVGRSRNIPVPLADPWFRFGEAARGLGRGIWKDLYSTGSTLSRLTDASYRKLLYAKIAANAWDGSRPSAEAALRKLIDDLDTNIWIDDGVDMNDRVCISGKLPSIVYAFLIEQNLIPVKAGGVRRRYYFVSVDRAPLFGFGVQNGFIAGLGTGAWGVSASRIRDNAL